MNKIFKSKASIYWLISVGLLLVSLILTIYTNIFGYCENSYSGDGEKYLYQSFIFICIVVAYIGVCVFGNNLKVLAKYIPFSLLLIVFITPIFIYTIGLGTSGFGFYNFSIVCFILFYLASLIFIVFSFTKNTIVQKIMVFVQIATLLYLLICCLFNIDLDVGYRVSGIQIPYAWVLSSFSIVFIFLASREVMLVTEVKKPIKSYLVPIAIKLKEYKKRFNDNRITYEEYESLKKETLNDSFVDNHKC